MAEAIATTAEAVRNSRLVELRDQISKIDVELLTLHGAGNVLSEVDEQRWDDLMTERAIIKPEHDKLEARAAHAEEIKATTFREIKGVPEFTRQRDEIAGADVRKLDVRVARDAALRILETRDSNYNLGTHQVDKVEKHVRLNTDIARRMIVTENEAYKSAFHKFMADGAAAAAYLEDDERQAMRRYYEYRAASEGTSSAGGYAIPVKLAA